jgi:hypothetical protein
MRLCVIGTSHVATLKQGWEAIAADHPEVAPTFFAAPLGKLASLKPEAGRLVSADAETRGLLVASGGSEAIPPGDFDAVLLAGLRLYLPRLDRRMSRALQETTLADVMAGMALTLAKRIRRLTPLPIFFAHEPLWADLPRYRRGEGQLLAYADVLAEMQALVPLRQAVLLPQPPETVSAAQLTPLAYSVETEPLEVVEAGGRAFDQVHMNARFGAEWWAANLPAITQAGG